MDKNSAEYKAIIALYEDGRITAERRDEMIAAFDAGGAEPGNMCAPVSGSNTETVKLDAKRRVHSERGSKDAPRPRRAEAPRIVMHRTDAFMGYDELVMSVEYKNGDITCKLFECTEYARDLLGKCRGVLSKGAYSMLKKLVHSEFVGECTYTDGGEKLKVRVYAPGGGVECF